MDRNPYVDLCLNVQALRRHFEGVRSPLVPALGVAASIYTHQLANVHRVLTDVRVRHLLADEVGLGKTIQALMVLNALRSQRADLRVLIVVPDRLVPQWRDEILTRAHTAPFDGSKKAEDGQYIRLAWEAQLRMDGIEGSAQFTLSDIDPGRFDVLVVDELHRLRADVQDRIVRVADKFSHVLLLTATPAFQRVERHAQLFALLEPQRAAIARWQVSSDQRGQEEQLTVGEDLSKWPQWATAAVVEWFLSRDRDTAASVDPQGLGTSAMVHCAYRRIIRTRRVDYSGVLPCRRHKPLVVEPIGAEVDRQSLMWDYLRRLDTLAQQFDPVLLAKRVILSPPSLEQRVDFFRRKGHDREGLLERIKPLVHRSQGDSRADALIDLLAGIWATDPTERILVAAQDNLTVDYLFDLVQARLPLLGPLTNRIPLSAVRVRQGMMTEAVDDLGGYGNETNENLEAFQRGSAQVLFAPEAAQVGLNLQCARVLVLYSVPWRPEEVEQWIGRLDRIGNVAAFSNDGTARSIDIYTIVQRGLVDEKVVAVLQHFHVFEKSVNLDGSHLDEVAKLIERAALDQNHTKWHELEDVMEVMAAEDEVQELNSPLREHLPWTVKSAIAERDRLESIPPAPPVLKSLPEHSMQGPRSWDRALEGMLKLLSRGGEYHIRWNTDPETDKRFQTLWYRFGEPGMYGRREVLAKVVFPFGADPFHDRSPQNALAFITRRGDIDNPPQRSVTMELDRTQFARPLRFLNFGDPLHDEIVKGWLPQSADLVGMDVSYFDGHAFWEHGKAGGMYLIRVVVADPASALLECAAMEEMLEALANAATQSDTERLGDLLMPYADAARAALEADVRWIRAQLTAAIKLDVRRRDQSHWVTASSEFASSLLNPMAHNGDGVPQARSLPLSEEVRRAVEMELSSQRQTDTSMLQSAWSHRFPDLDQATAVRLAIVEEDGRDALELARLELQEAERMLNVASERGNPAQIVRAQKARDAAADRVDLTRVFWDKRCRWLRECADRIRELVPREWITALIRARKVN